MGVLHKSTGWEYYIVVEVEQESVTVDLVFNEQTTSDSSSIVDGREAEWMRQ